MIRILSIFRYYFGWQRTLAVTTVCGLVLIALGAVIYPEPISMFPILLGLVLCLLFPVIFSCVAYRELISNARFALVPNLRAAAAVSLFLMAVTAAIANYALLTLMTRFESELPPSAIPLITVLVFTLASLYLLVTQWLITKKNGILLLFVVPLLLARFAVELRLDSTIGMVTLALLATAALFGWAWLLRTALRPGRPKPSTLVAAGTRSVSDSLSSQRADVAISTSTKQGNFDPAGTLLRGTPDGWQQRVIKTSLMLLGFPLMIYVILSVFSLVFGAGSLNQSIIGVEFLLFWSFLGFVSQASTRSLEWPARLRLLWLRTAGDRRGSWRTVENSLLADTAVCAVLAGIIALVCLAFTDALPVTLLLYASGCVLMSLVTSYAGFWTRASRLSRLLHVIAISGFLGMGIGGFFAASNSANPGSGLWLLAAATLLALVLRVFARRSVVRIDWCAVRPVRLTREQPG